MDCTLQKHQKHQERQRKFRETKKTWQWNTMYDPGLNPGPGKETRHNQYYWENWPINFQKRQSHERQRLRNYSKLKESYEI